jgi:hypothetical protein
MNKKQKQDKLWTYHLSVLSDGIGVYSKDQKYKFLWKTIHCILLVLTFGKMNKFYNRYTTVIGNNIFFPAGWTWSKAYNENYESTYITLKHECDGHVKQFRKEGLVKMSFKYLFLPFPFKFAKYRYHYEREAYLEGIKAIIELGYEPDIERYVNILTGPEYLWAWHNKNDVRQWFTEQINKFKEERAVSEK